MRGMLRKDRSTLSSRPSSTRSTEPWMSIARISSSASFVFGTSNETSSMTLPTTADLPRGPVVVLAEPMPQIEAEPPPILAGIDLNEGEVELAEALPESAPAMAKIPRLARYCQ